MRRNIFLCLLLLLSLMLASACYRGKEACLDPSARNFDAEADRNCCCQYYRLQIKLQHLMEMNGDTLPFAFGNAYLDAAGDTFRVTALPFLLSDLRLVRADGSEMGVRGRILLETANGAVEVPNSFVIADAGTLVADFGDVSDLGSFERLRFYVGLPANINQTDGNLPAEHPLSALNTRGLYRSIDEGYTFFRPDVRIGADTSNTLFPVYGNASLVAIDLPFAQTYALLDGMDARLDVDIFYSTLFSGISFQQDDSATVANKLLANTPNTFRINNP